MGRNSPEFEESLAKNRELRARGLIPCVWMGTPGRLKAVGIKVEKRADAPVHQLERPGQRVGKNAFWAERWAVLIAEAEPCNEDAKDWALEKVAADAEFRAAIETIAALIDTEGARAKMAEFVMGQWEPGS